MLMLGMMNCSYEHWTRVGFWSSHGDGGKRKNFKTFRQQTQILMGIHHNCSKLHIIIWSWYKIIYQCNTFQRYFGIAWFWSDFTVRFCSYLICYILVFWFKTCVVTLWSPIFYQCSFMPLYLLHIFFHLPTQVYDVTQYLDDHPGGDDVILDATGNTSYIFATLWTALLIMQKFIQYPNSQSY